MRTDPRVLIGVAAAAGLVRVLASSRMPSNPAEAIPLFHRPWHRVPLLDLVTLPVGGLRQAVALGLGMATVIAVVAFADRALPRSGRIGVAIAAVLLPPLVWAGAWWAHSGLTILLAVVAAGCLLTVLEGGDAEAQDQRVGFPSALAFATWLLLLSDWPAWAPVLAWTGWLAVFPPGHVPPDARRRAVVGLGSGIAAALPLYAAVLAYGGDPEAAMRAREIPLGPEALVVLLDGVAGLGLGRSAGLPPAVRGIAAVVVVAAAWLGFRRAGRGGRAAWAGVAFVGGLGAYVPALAIHQWIPVAADKHVWYMAPFVLCLGIATVSGVRER